MKISIIIPTYNRSSLIIRTLDSFLNQNFKKNDFEIIVINNNSLDNTEIILKKYIKAKEETFQIRYLNEKKQGVHYARNTGAKYAKFDLLYFTDDDMIADQNLLQEIALTYTNFPNITCLTGKVLPIWESNPPSWILRYCKNQYLSLLDLNIQFMIAPRLNMLYSCHQVIRKNAFFKVEGFNPEYTYGKYLGDGETGLNLKLEKNKYLFAYNSRAITSHIIPEKRLKQKYFINRIKNNAVAHNYTRYHKLGKFSLVNIFKLFILHTIYSAYQVAFSIYVVIRDFSFGYLNMLPGFILYFFSGNLFLFQVSMDKNIRKFVDKDDWLTNDNLI